MSEERTDRLRAELERFDGLQAEVMRAFANVMRELDPEGGAEVRTLADGLLISGGRFAPPIQMLAHAGRERELTDEEIAHVERFFAAKTGSGYAYIVEGLNDVLTGALEERGWVQRTPHELFRIRTEQWVATQRGFEEIEIRPVASDEVETVLQMAACCWLEREPREPSDLLIGRGFQGIEFGHLHAAWMDGEPVGYAHLRWKRNRCAACCLYTAEGAETGRTAGVDRIASCAGGGTRLRRGLGRG